MSTIQTNPYGAGPQPTYPTTQRPQHQDQSNPWVQTGVKYGGDLIGKFLASQTGQPWLANVPGMITNPSIKGAASLGMKLPGVAASGAGQAAGQVLGKAIPLVGAGVGLYNMIQNKGTLSNVLSGAGTGASIGSMIMPGIGTGIGAGIGAAAGGIESLFNIGKPSEEELHNRTGQGDIIKMLQQNETPQQKADVDNLMQQGSHKGAFGHTVQPDGIYQNLAILGRDAFGQAGMNADQADVYVQDLLNTHDTAKYQQGVTALQQALMNRKR
jgi:hypothetical protein